MDSYGCNPNQVNQTNQLWVVGSPADMAQIFNASGSLVPNLVVSEPFSNYLQTDAASGLSDSVIENVATLVADGWGTTTAPVLSATYSNLAGIDSGLVLQAQTFPVETMNSTWDIEPAFTPPPSNSSNNPCAGLNAYAALLCVG